MSVKIGDKVQVARPGSQWDGDVGIAAYVDSRGRVYPWNVTKQCVVPTGWAPADIHPYVPPSPPPDPTPPPSTMGTMKGYNGFGAGSWPPAAWRPFAPSSTWNTPAASLTEHERSSSIAKNMLAQAPGGGPGNLIIGASTVGAEGWLHPAYWAQSSDPLFTLKITSSPYGIKPGEQIHCPVKARAENGSDGHMTVVQPDGTAYDLFQAVVDPVAMTITAYIGGRCRVYGDGWDGGAATASHASLQAGQIRAEELIAGRVNHALFGVFGYGSRMQDFGHGVQRSKADGDYLLPAKNGDRYRDGVADLLPMGGRMRLNYTAPEIAALPIPAYRKTIVTALAEYGMIFGDTSQIGLGLQLASGAGFTSLGYPDPLVAWAQAQGLSLWRGTYVLPVAPGVDWTRLRVVV
jgi:hypothetical protein